MRRNLKPAQNETRADRTPTVREPRTRTQDLLEPMGNPEALWEEDADSEPRADGDEPDDEADGLEGEPKAATEEKEADESTGPDDALGLYLRQMGAIPLLSRQQELDLARR